ncbi:hypothetical protein [Ferrovum sp.]|uniref:hypothetical protein n=1 Tax=Ferrovum sp. TaxID=2609467 RepID=UPI002618C92E|nr:hypothetical protein [Ferrovum sp.]
MEFADFALDCGLLIKNFVIGKIARCPTRGHPHKENGAYFFEGDFGWCQDWEFDSSPRYWKEDKPRSPEEEARFAERVRLSKERHAREIAQAQKKAAEKAQWILTQCKLETHAYLDKKGFPDAEGMVWRPTGDENLLIIPMKNSGKIVGCQMIDRDGNKKFLYGQRSKGAVFTIGNGKLPVYCEGYATGLSIARALQALRQPFSLCVCFSASNLITIAQRGPKGLVVADNDASGVGERAAQQIGYPYFLPPQGDFNDYWKEVGLFRASQALKKTVAGLL